MKLVNFQHDVVLGTPQVLDVERIIHEPLTIVEVACSWSRVPGMAYVGLLHRSLDEVGVKDTVLEQDVTGGVIDASELQVLKGLTIEPGVLRLSGFTAGYAPPGYHEGYTTRFTFVLACREARPVLREPQAREGAAVELPLESGRKVGIAEVVELVVVPEVRLRPKRITTADGLPWSVEGVMVGPRVVLEKTTHFRPKSMVGNLPNPEGTLDCTGWPDVDAGTCVRIKVRAQAPGRTFKAVLHGVELT